MHSLVRPMCYIVFMIKEMENKMELACYKCEVDILMSTPLTNDEYALCYDCAMDKAGY